MVVPTVGARNTRRDELDRRLARGVRARGSLGRTRAPGLPQHPDQHRPERPILLAVDQELGEGAALRVAQELPNPVHPLEVGSIRTWSSSARGAGRSASEALAQHPFELLAVHRRTLAPERDTLGRAGRVLAYARAPQVDRTLTNAFG
jgi:hypothetical protein